MGHSSFDVLHFQCTTEVENINPQPNQLYINQYFPTIFYGGGGAGVINIKICSHQDPDKEVFPKCNVV